MFEKFKEFFIMVYMEISNKDTLHISHELPQHLCNMCGKCCKAITTPFSYDELKEMADDGQEEAKVFIDVFKPYTSIEEARKAVPDHVENIINQLKNNGDFDESKLTFFYCPNLTSDNKCSIHEVRPDCCRRAPRNGWSLFPPGCGFKGWQFQQKERVKSTVRKLKEYLMELELLSDDYFFEDRNKTAKELKEFIHEKISPWYKYGAKYW